MLIDELKVVNFAGGTEKFICAMASEFVRRGNHVSIVCMDREEGLPLYPLDARVRFVNLAFSYGKPFNNMIWFLKKIEKESLRAVLGRKMSFFGHVVGDPKRQYYLEQFIKRLDACVRDGRPDIILTVSPDGAWMAQQVLEMQNVKNIPIIAMCRTDPIHSNIIKSSRHIEVWKHCAKVQVLLQPFVSMVRNMGIESVVQIPNSVNQIPDDKIVDLSECHHRIISVGRIDGASKRQHLLVEAFSLIAHQYPNWHIEFYGSIGSQGYMKRVRRAIARYRLERQIQYKGVSHDIPAVLRESDFIVFTSKFEGFSNAMAEAMSYGLPVIAYKSCFSIASMVTDKISGILAEDTTESLAAAIAQLIEHQDLRIQMGANAHMAMKQYTPEFIWDQWDKVMDEVVGEKFLCG